MKERETYQHELTSGLARYFVRVESAATRSGSQGGSPPRLKNFLKIKKLQRKMNKLSNSDKIHIYVLYCEDSDF